MSGSFWFMIGFATFPLLILALIMVLYLFDKEFWG